MGGGHFLRDGVSVAGHSQRAFGGCDFGARDNESAFRGVGSILSSMEFLVGSECLPSLMPVV